MNVLMVITSTPIRRRIGYVLPSFKLPPNRRTPLRTPVPWPRPRRPSLTGVRGTCPGGQFCLRHTRSLAPRRPIEGGSSADSGRQCDVAKPNRMALAHGDRIHVGVVCHRCVVHTFRACTIEVPRAEGRCPRRSAVTLPVLTESGGLPRLLSRSTGADRARVACGGPEIRGLHSISASVAGFAANPATDRVMVRRSCGRRSDRRPRGASGWPRRRAKSARCRRPPRRPSPAAS